MAVATLAVGAVLLAISLRLEPGDSTFYLTTLALAGVWVVGSFLSGPLHLGWANTRADGRHARPLVQPLCVGLLAVAVFAAGAVGVAQVPVLRDSANEVLDHAASRLDGGRCG